MEDALAGFELLFPGEVLTSSSMLADGEEISVGWILDACLGLRSRRCARRGVNVELCMAGWLLSIAAKLLSGPAGSPTRDAKF